MKYNRVKEIEDYVLENESVSIDNLCEIFNVSKNTIRRDIKELVDKGTIEKIYGGVVANSINKSNQNNLLSSFDERNTINIQEKEIIGKKAASFIDENDIIFIDSGTTTFQILSHLKDIMNLTVITNNLNVLNILFNLSNINAIAVGGNMIRKTNSFAGIGSVGFLENLNITKCFMSTTGISIQNGLTNSTLAEFQLKKAVIERSSEVFLLADSSKFGVSSLMTFCELKNVNTVITSNKPSNEYIDFFNKNNINLVIGN